jgi:hypothetical protein
LDPAVGRDAVREVVPFNRLVMEVSLFVDGGIGHRPTRLLSEGVWNLHVAPEEALRFLTASAPQHVDRLLPLTSQDADADRDMVFVVRGMGLCVDTAGHEEPLEKSFPPLLLPRGPRADIYL